jgi:hypothetical protein
MKSAMVSRQTKCPNNFEMKPDQKDQLKNETKENSKQNRKWHVLNDSK